MFCPSCGSEERQASQFCRGCGSDLRAVKISIERPDSITASAVSAREEIARAVAQKIREVEDAAGLKQVAHEVLPEIEKFLESPEEKRLRRLRAGVVLAAIGLGTGILGLILSEALHLEDAEAGLWVGGLGVIAFALGLGIILNGLLFTKPKKALDDEASARLKNLLDADYHPPKSIGEARTPTTSNLVQRAGPSITEHTTHHLKKD